MRDRQDNFGAGELSPTMWGRWSFRGYGAGARTAKNFFVSPHGALMNRPGTRVVMDYVSPVPAPGTSIKVEAFALTSGAVYFMVFKWTGGGINIGSLDVCSQGTVPPYQLSSVANFVTTYAAAELREMKFAQRGDTITVTCLNHIPYVLSYASGAWSFAQVSYAATAFPTASHAPRVQVDTLRPADATHRIKEWTWKATKILKDGRGGYYETAAADVAKEFTYGAGPIATWDAAVTYGLNDIVAHWDDTQKKLLYWKSLQAGNLNHHPPSASWWDPDFAAWTAEADVRHEIVLFADAPVDLYWSQDPPEVYATRIYRGRGTLFGLVGETGADNFRDEGAEPDYSNPPPAGRNPFAVVDPEGVDPTTYDWPRCVSYFEGRRYFGGGEDLPARIWGSAVERYSNFDAVPVPDDSDALEFDLVGTRSVAIQNIVPCGNLIAFTPEAEFVVTGDGQSGLVTPNAIAAHPVSYVGSDSLTPLVVDSAVMFIKRKGLYPYALTFSTEGGGRVPTDLSVLARHLFDGHHIDDWCYAKDPYSVVWAVRNDGTLLSLTYLPEHNIIAWCQHEIAGDGKVESITSVPYGSRDAVYMVVRRGAYPYQRTIEELTTRSVSAVADGVFLDASVSVYGGVPSDVPQVVTVPHVLEGLTVYAVADGNVLGPYVVGATLQVTLDATYATVHVGLKYDCDFESLDLAQEKGRQKIVESVVLDYEGSRGGYLGTSLTGTMAEWRQRTVAHEYATIPLESGEVTIPIPSQWATNGRIAVRQSDPFPLTILGLTRIYHLGEP